MKRTQLYMDEDSLRLLSSLSRHQQTTISELVRQAVTQVYGTTKTHVDPVEALQASFGVWAQRKDLAPTAAYVRSLRKGHRATRLKLP
ncbi:MAG: ribbon-helix-helix protein, CopG family [Deltaproteobacteria bacterium]|nr:ribbon-helix-helix protein, CopG family [Deltaproteobacteria bacterium]